MNVPALPFPRARERANPVLVRELRQAFRGKQFRVVFAISSAFGLVASWIAIVASDDPKEIGQGLFIALGIALSIACLVLVPVGAFQSLASEWEEGTWDLLELTDLRPRRIVLGKLQTAAIQCLLYFFGMAPFLVFCFVLRGVGPLLILLLMGHLVIGSLTATAVGIALSSLTRQRVLRGVLMGLFVMFLVQTGGVAASSLLGAAALSAGSLFGSGVGWIAAAGYVTAMATVAAFAYCIACARLAHPEENRSTPLRIVASCSVATHFVWMAAAKAATPMGADDIGISMLIAIAFVGVIGSLFASEHDPLGRRARLQVPANGLRARLAAPWLPGGARGIAWLALHLGALVLATPLLIGGSGGYWSDVASCVSGVIGAWIPLSGASGGAFSSEWQGKHTGSSADPVAFCAAVVIGACFVMFYVGTTTSLLALIRSRSTPLRVLRAFAPLFLFVATALVPGLIGLLLSDGELASLMHPFNPVAVILGLFGRVEGEAWKWYPIALAALGIGLSVPRTLRAFAEIASASAQRRERERHGGAVVARAGVEAS